MFLRRSHSANTRFIRLDSRACEACWQCLAVCHKHALGKVDIFGHKHVKIAEADRCAGCLKCVKACGSGAITAIVQPKEGVVEVTSEVRPFNTRAFVSLGIFISALILPVSGIYNHELGLSGLTQERHFWMAVHNSAAALFTCFAAAHIVLNRKALIRHIRLAKDRLISKEAMAVAALVIGIVVVFASHALHGR